MQVFFHDLLWVAVAFKSHVLQGADINVMDHQLYCLIINVYHNLVLEYQSKISL